MKVRGRFDMDFDFRFSEGDGKTVVAVHATVQPRGASRLLSPLLGPMMRRDFAKRPEQMSRALAAARSQ